MQNTSFKKTVVNILRALKKNLILLLSIIIGFSAVGVVVGLTIDQRYTATQMATFKAGIVEDEENPYDYTATKVYLDTVKDFFKSGNVLKRANAYYDEFDKNRDKFASVDEYSNYIYETYEKSYKYDEIKARQSEFTGKEIYFDVVLHVGNGTGYELMNRKVIGIFERFETKTEVKNGVSAPGNLKVECLVISHVVDQSVNEVLRCGYVLDGSAITYNELVKITEYKDFYADTSNYVYATNFKFRENVATVESDADHYQLENVKITGSSGVDDTISFAIGVGYSDADSKVAVEKARILIMALDIESKTCVPNSNEASTVSDYLAEFKYFGVKISLADWGTWQIEKEVSVLKIILMFVGIGVLISLLAVYLVTVISKTESEQVKVEEPKTESETKSDKGGNE